MSTNVNIEGAERLLSLLSKFMLIAYIGLPLSFILASGRNASAGETSPMDYFIMLLLVIATLAILLCPILIGVVASKIGKSGIMWGGLSFLFSPFGQLVAYFKLKSAVDEAAHEASRANFNTAFSK